MANLPKKGLIITDVDIIVCHQEVICYEDGIEESSTSKFIKRLNEIPNPQKRMILDSADEKCFNNAGIIQVGYDPEINQIDFIKDCLEKQINASRILILPYTKLPDVKDKPCSFFTEFQEEYVEDPFKLRDKQVEYLEEQKNLFESIRRQYGLTCIEESALDLIDKVIYEKKDSKIIRLGPFTSFISNFFKFEMPDDSE